MILRLAKRTVFKLSNSRFEVVHCVPEDREWVLKLWGKYRKILGVDEGKIWFRFWRDRNPEREFWVKIEQYAFLHYRFRRDGVTTLYELAVDQEKTRFLTYEIAKALVVNLPPPLRLKTDKTNLLARHFYESLGFVCEGKTESRDKKREILHYAKV